MTVPLDSHKDRLKPPAFGPHLPLKIRPSFSIDKRSCRRISSILSERKSKRAGKSVLAKSSKLTKKDLPVPKFLPSQVLGSKLLDWQRPYRPSSNISYKKKNLSGGPSASSSNPRPKNRFVDDSAVEVDSDGDSIPSRASSPELEVHPRPSGQFAIPRVRPQIKPVTCKFCFVQCSGPKALEFHQSSNKCKNRRDYQLKHKCFDCNRLFETTHDLERHIFSKH